MPKRKINAVEAQQTAKNVPSPAASASTPLHKRQKRASTVPTKATVTNGSDSSPVKRRRGDVVEKAITTAAPDQSRPKSKKTKQEAITPKPKKIKQEVALLEAKTAKQEIAPSKPKKSQQKKTIKQDIDASKTEKTGQEIVVEEEPIATTTTKVTKGSKVKQEESKIEVKTVIYEVKPKIRKKRKTKEEKEAEAMPLAARTIGHRLFVGAHVSASGGVHNAVTNSVKIGGNAFALFLKSQRKWANPALTEDIANSYHSACKEHDYDCHSHVVPHGSYLVNLAHTDGERTKQAYDSFLDDLQRCERLGIKLYNFHPGNTAGNDRAIAIKHLATNLNRAHSATTSVVTLLENMAAAGGNVIGTSFEDLRDIISHIIDKDRVGVCLDTCHAFAAGYDLRSPEAYEQTMQQFDEVVGLKYLRALHLNDSKAPLGARRDLHANIGTGFLGLRAFHNVANDSRLAGLPLVLETPISVTDDDGELLKDEKGNEKSDAGIWAREIKLIESLTGMDTTSTPFLELEKSLTRKGAKERKRIADQAERRVIKDAKKAAKGKKKVKQAMSDDSELSELEEE